MLTGIQDKFSWKCVAMAAIGGGVGGGIGLSGIFDKGGALGNLTGFSRGAVSGALGNLANQGIALATGLQAKFDWAGLAGAALGGGVGELNFGLGKISERLAQTVSTAASTLANAAARSLIDGTGFGDNVLAALPDVIGQTIGNAMVRAVEAMSRPGSKTIESPKASGGHGSSYEPTGAQGAPLTKEQLAYLQEIGLS